LRSSICVASSPAATVQVSLGAVIMLMLSPVLATGPVRLSVAVVISVLALGAVGTGLAYVWNNNVVTAWGATNASTVTYLTPVVGVILGVAILREPLAWNEPVGAVIVIIGVTVSQGRFQKVGAPA
jgi:drug/metabolite transporter (DMT)-like permease